ncbi:hypothetical protein WJX79_005286 [Trebouxia sp. C0005]
MAATDSVQTTSTISLKVLAPLAIGLILFVCHLVAIPVDGYCVNPARGFGPAVVSRTFHRYWIFWVGPLTGAAVAAFIYQTVFKVRGDASGLGAKPIKGKNQRILPKALLWWMWRLNEETVWRPASQSRVEKPEATKDLNAVSLLVQEFCYVSVYSVDPNSIPPSLAPLIDERPAAGASRAFRRAQPCP